MSNLSEYSSGDPFTLLYCGLWDCLENSQEFLDRVAPANRIKWLGMRIDPRKQQATDSDRPQVRIDFADPFMEPDQLTGTELLRCRWNICVATGKQPIDHPGYAALGSSIAPVLWACYRALLGYGQSLKGLTYGGALFCYRVKPGMVSVWPPDGNRELQEGLNGWTAVLPYYTWVEFNTLANLPTPVSE